MAQIARFATRLQPKQRAALALPIKKDTRRFYEVPGYSVFYTLLSRLDPEILAQALNGWLRENSGTLPSALSLDGNMIRDVIRTVTLADHQDGSPVALAVMDQKEGTQTLRADGSRSPGGVTGESGRANSDGRSTTLPTGVGQDNRWQFSTATQRRLPPTQPSLSGPLPL